LITRPAVSGADIDDIISWEASAASHAPGSEVRIGRIEMATIPPHIDAHFSASGNCHRLNLSTTPSMLTDQAIHHCFRSKLSSWNI
jgi:hypothetical protein